MKTIKPIIATIAVTGALTFANATVASSICKKTFTSGAGSTKFEWCFSDDGNIVNLEHPEGLEPVMIGTLTDRYCDSAGGTKRGESFGSQANSMLQEAKRAGRKVRHDDLVGGLILMHTADLRCQLGCDGCHDDGWSGVSERKHFRLGEPWHVKLRNELLEAQDFAGGVL